MFDHPMLNLPTFDDLMAQLQAADPVRRAQAAYLLGELGDRRAVAALIAALDDEHEDVRDEALTALCHIGDERAVEALVAVLRETRHAHPVRNLVTQAVGNLWRLGAAAIEPLLALLNDSREGVRWNAARALARFDDPRLLPTFIDLLAASQPRLRSAAVGYLKRRGQEAVEPLLAVLTDGPHHAQMTAARTLGALEDARAVEPLLACLTSDDIPLAQAAAIALLNLNDERGVAAVVAWLQEPPHGFSVPILLGNYYEVSPVMLPLIMQWAADPDPVLRLAAIRALCGSEDYTLVPVLINALADPDEAVVGSAAFALREFEDKRAVDPLLALLSHRSADVRQQAAYGLAGTDDPRIVPTLLDLLHDPDDEMRHSAISSLGYSGDARAEEAVLAFIKDEDWWTRQYVCEALGHLEARGGIPALMETLQHDAEGIVRQEAAKALGRIGASEAVEALGAALLDYWATVPMEARHALEVIGTPDALAIFKAWDEWRGR